MLSLPPVVEAIQYPAWREWYTRETWSDGRIVHFGPWSTRWAADALTRILTVRHEWELRRAVARRDDTGNGDTCPLFPHHGNMLVLTGTTPPLQYCPHQQHDPTPGKSGQPASRNRWPLFGFEESVVSYMARLDRAIRLASLPDLSDLEVN